ncbi:hypothetical protein BCPG1_194 [Bacillus phage BCPG1]|nr:hypothetical protein BCPG1_194 [Bacillus phage BCPG1]
MSVNSITPFYNCQTIHNINAIQIVRLFTLIRTLELSDYLEHSYCQTILIVRIYF